MNSARGPAAASVSFDWRGEPLQLLGAKAAWDTQLRALFVADLHLGKAETFQAHGIPLPSDGDGETLNGLLELAHQLEPQQVRGQGQQVGGRILKHQRYR